MGGTCLDKLELPKPLNEVINEIVHSTNERELVEQLAKDGRLLFCTPATLADTVEEGDLDDLAPWPADDVGRFVSWLNEFVGVRAQ